MKKTGKLFVRLKKAVRADILNASSLTLPGQEQLQLSQETLDTATDLAQRIIGEEAEQSEWLDVLEGAATWSRLVAGLCVQGIMKKAAPEEGERGAK
jgi:hypothetical protein